MVFSKSTVLVRPVYYSILDREVNIFQFLVTMYLDKGNEKCIFFLFNEKLTFIQTILSKNKFIAETPEFATLWQMLHGKHCEK